MTSPAEAQAQRGVRAALRELWNREDVLFDLSTRIEERGTATVAERALIARELDAIEALHADVRAVLHEWVLGSDQRAAAEQAARGLPLRTGTPSASRRPSGQCVATAPCSPPAGSVPFRLT